MSDEKRKNADGDTVEQFVKCECPWCPDGGEVSPISQEFHGATAYRSVCELCGVAGPYGQTKAQAVEWFNLAFNKGITGEFA